MGYLDAGCCPECGRQAQEQDDNRFRWVCVCGTRWGDRRPSGWSDE